MQGEDEQLAEQITLPLIDLKIKARLRRASEGRLANVAARLSLFLRSEANKLPAAETKARAKLIETAQRLSNAATEFITIARGAPINVLDAAYDLMATTAEAASRIERKQLPPAIEKAAKKKIASANGKRSGDKRRKKAAATWEPHAEELALQARCNNPGASQEAIADEIISGWKLTSCEPPGHRTSVRFVSALIKVGKLPPRTSS